MTRFIKVATIGGFMHLNVDEIISIRYGDKGAYIELKNGGDVVAENPDFIRHHIHNNYTKME